VPNERGRREAPIRFQKQLLKRQLDPVKIELALQKLLLEAPARS